MFEALLSAGTRPSSTTIRDNLCLIVPMFFIIDGVFLLNALINCYKPKMLDRERGCIDVLIFTANVLYGSWILVGIGLTEKCQLHLRKVAPEYLLLNVGYIS